MSTQNTQRLAAVPPPSSTTAAKSVTYPAVALAVAAFSFVFGFAVLLILTVDYPPPLALLLGLSGVAGTLSLLGIGKCVSVLWRQLLGNGRGTDGELA